MALFTADTHFVVYMDAKRSDPFAGASLARSTLSCLRRPPQIPAATMPPSSDRARIASPRHAVIDVEAHGRARVAAVV